MQQKKEASSSSSFARDAFAGQNTSDRPPLVGKEIQRLRQEHQLTLDELASKSGVSKSILSQIERDHSNPTLSTIWRISQALKQPLVDMLSSGEEKPRFEHLKLNQTPVVSSTDGKFVLVFDQKAFAKVNSKIETLTPTKSHIIEKGIQTDMKPENSNSWWPATDSARIVREYEFTIGWALLDVVIHSDCKKDETDCQVQYKGGFSVSNDRVTDSLGVIGECRH